MVKNYFTKRRRKRIGILNAEEINVETHFSRILVELCI
jgi:hypothetical protein